MMIKRCLSYSAILIVASMGATFAYLEIREGSEQVARHAAHQTKPYRIRDFAQVTQTLDRGAQPQPSSYPQLKQLGVGIVVSFRNSKSVVEGERRTVEALSIRFVNIPLYGSLAPENKKVAEFLELMRSNADKMIFAHCQAGHDRTGVMVAAYRMAIQNWTPGQALQEMEKYHYDPDLDPDQFLSKWRRRRWSFRQAWQEGSKLLLEQEPLKLYVESFPQQLQTDPSFRSVVPVQQTARDPNNGSGELR